MSPVDHRLMHKCGACGTWLFTGRIAHTGTLIHVEKARDGAGDLLHLPDLPLFAEGQPRHFTRTRTRKTGFREHDCPALKSHTGRRPERKVR